MRTDVGVYMHLKKDLRYVVPPVPLRLAEASAAEVVSLLFSMEGGDVLSVRGS